LKNGQAGYKEGWRENRFEPIKAYLGGRNGKK
jgi:hypothetical protein